MKKMMTILFALVMVINANAQAKLSFPSAWMQYGQQNFQYQRSQDLGGGNWRDIYLYQGKEVFNDGYCQTCSQQASQPVNVDNSNSNTVITYNEQIEAAKVAEMKRTNDIYQQKVDNDYKMAKKENRREWINGTWRNANETSNQVAVWKDKYKSTTNVETNVLTTSTGTPPIVQPGRGYDAGGITLAQNPSQSPIQVIDYTLGNQNNNQNQQGSGNGGDQGGISPCGVGFIWLNGGCVRL